MRCKRIRVLATSRVHAYFHFVNGVRNPFFALTRKSQYTPPKKICNKPTIQALKKNAILQKNMGGGRNDYTKKSPAIVSPPILAPLDT